jgi:hypothetical protein
LEAAAVAFPEPVVDSEAAEGSRAVSDLEASAPPKVRSSRLAGSESLTLLAASGALAMRLWVVDSVADTVAAAVEAVAI